MVLVNLSKKWTWTALKNEKAVRCAQWALPWTNTEKSIFRNFKSLAYIYFMYSVCSYIEIKYHDLGFLCQPLFITSNIFSSTFAEPALSRNQIRHTVHKVNICSSLHFLKIFFSVFVHGSGQCVPSDWPLGGRPAKYWKTCNIVN